MTTEYPMVDVVKVKPMEAFRLWVRFSDGSEGVADLSGLAARTGPMVAPLNEPRFFQPGVRRGRRAVIGIADGRIIAGSLPPTALRLVTEWAPARRRRANLAERL